MRREKRLIKDKSRQASLKKGIKLTRARKIRRKVKKRERRRGKVK